MIYLIKFHWLFTVLHLSHHPTLLHIYLEDFTLNIIFVSNLKMIL